MTKYRFHAVALLLMLISACSTPSTLQPDSFATPPAQATPQTDASIVTSVQSFPTNTLEPTKSPSSSKLQLTYLEYKNDFMELYAIDVTCIENNHLCFGAPILLFKTLPVSSNDRTRPKGFIRGYSWSPDGTQMALSAGADVFIGDLNSPEWQNITDSPDIYEYDPQWSPDGKYVYYLSCSEDSSGMGSCKKVVRYDLAQKNIHVLLDVTDKSIGTFAVSPNGKSIVFSVSKGFDRLYQSDLEGLDIHQVTVTELEETSPSFSYDGQSIAYVRTNRPIMVAETKLQSDIILQNSKWEDKKNLTEEFEEIASGPAFSLDGRWIAFEGYDKQRNYNIYIVSVDQTALIQVTHGSGGRVHPSWRLFSGQ